MKTQYDAISGSYAEMVKTDPQKNFVQYPSALKLLGEVTGQRILEIGCGSGSFARLLADKGAQVTAYDNSPGQIAAAQTASTDSIEFLVADPTDFRADQEFDQAVTILVLHYAVNREHLRQFFASTYASLKPGGRFICILFSPELKRLDTPMYNRRFRKIGRGRMVVDFLDHHQQVSCSAEHSDFSSDDYEQAAVTGGFSRFEWIPLSIENGGVEAMGEAYWREFIEDCPYVGFVAQK